jgi:hypothetical protein
MRYHSGLAVGHIDGHVRTEAVGATRGSPQDNHATENPETETELDLKSTDHLDSDDPEFDLDNFEDDLGDDNEGNDGEGEEEDEVDYEENDELQMSMYDMYGPIGVY